MEPFSSRHPHHLVPTLYTKVRNNNNNKNQAFCPLWMMSSSSSPSSSSTKDDGSSVLEATTATASSLLLYRAQYNATVSFPPYEQLMQLRFGDFVTSETLTVRTENGEEYDFCVKLYPRGGGHSSQHSVFNKKQIKSGFGMSYRSMPLFGAGASDEKVAVYLQFLPRSPHQEVDASFGLRLLGRQAAGQPRFDVEWRAGMRFVGSDNDAKLALGRANDFGAHLMQTPLLANVLGVTATDDENDGLHSDSNEDSSAINGKTRNPSQEPVQVQVEILIHKTPKEMAAAVAATTPIDQPATAENAAETADTRAATTETNDRNSAASGTSGFGLFALLKDIRQKSNDNDNNCDDDQQVVRVGQVVVPVLQNLSERPRLLQQGTYPGVEYRILRILDPQTNQDLFYHEPGVDYELKPIYPLVSQLERPWPVRVKEGDIPKLVTRQMYNVLSAVGSLLTATGLALAVCISQAVSLFVIPTRSMDPTLQVGDVLLVDKVTPRLFRNQIIQPSSAAPTSDAAGVVAVPGPIVLFQPPQQLQDIVAQSSGRSVASRDLFVKRIAATTGSIVSVDAAGQVQVDGQRPYPGGVDGLCTAEPLRLIEKYIRPVQNYRIPAGQVAVLGDCPSVSVDSRVWGPLPVDKIVGIPVLRLWPLERFGPIPTMISTGSGSSSSGNTIPSSLSTLTTDWSSETE